MEGTQRDLIEGGVVDVRLLKQGLGVAIEARKLHEVISARKPMRRKMDRESQAQASQLCFSQGRGPQQGTEQVATCSRGPKRSSAETGQPRG